jgi:hypothetical protein
VPASRFSLREPVPGTAQAGKRCLDGKLADAHDDVRPGK